MGNRNRMLVRLLLVTSIVALMTSEAEAQGASSVDWRAVAAKIVERMAPVRGERILLVGIPGVADSLVAPLRAAVSASGAIDLGAIAEGGNTPAAWSTDYVRELSAKSGAARDEFLRTVDVAVMMPGPAASDAIYSAMQRVLGTGRGRTVHFHWVGAYELTGRAIPTTPDVALLYQRALLETDYAALAARQQALESAMRRGDVRVTTPAGTDIRFRVGDRPVTKQDGDASATRARSARNLIDREIELPAGAVRVAPLEESVEGTIVFPPSLWSGERVDGLVLTFARGRVTAVQAQTGREAVERELAAGGDAGRAFREFALGMNPLLAIPADGRRFIPYYGYGAGVVRLSLGDNSELGGNVRGPYTRWNFFTDATITVAGDVWVRDGKLVR